MFDTARSLPLSAGGGKDGGVTIPADLIDAVDEAFYASVDLDVTPWPDPHEGDPADEAEYSRLLDPGKWRIIGARADAWLDVLTRSGLALVRRDVEVEWGAPQGAPISRVDLVVPRRHKAPDLVVARSVIDGVEGAGVWIGTGAPVEVVAWLPHCGCDACDRGSQVELDALDELMLRIVSGWWQPGG